MKMFKENDWFKRFNGSKEYLTSALSEGYRTNLSDLKRSLFADEKELVLRPLNIECLK